MKANSIFLFILILNTTLSFAQKKERIKIDGVSAVIGKNIVLDSDIEKFKLELKQRSEGEINISDCEMLEKVMLQKLIAHHAVVDSVVVSDAEVSGEVQKTINYFKQQLGSTKKVVEFYGFLSEKELREELAAIQREQILIQRKKSNIVKGLDVTPEAVRNYYKNLEKNGNLPEFGSEIELAQIVKILKPSEKEIERVLAKLTGLKKDIENGYSFRLKAALNSDDPAVSQNGGKYTLTRDSQFVKEFKEAAFRLEEGELSAPFESGFGYHILMVEKIKGQERDVRHILIQPKITEFERIALKNSLAQIKDQIEKGELSFEEAVKNHSEDEDTKSNNGLLINPQTNDTRFDLTRMDPDLFKRISSLKQGEITSPFYEEVRAGKKMYKLLMMKSKTENHLADLSKDYEKIKKLTLQRKKEETLEKWASDKIDDTYIKINKNFRNCDFSNGWQ
jgi:peptidyl-prolyl cis-trans isomerase SurA